LDAPLPPANAIFTRTEAVWLSGDGIIHAITQPDLVMTLEDAMENTRAFATVGGGVRRLAVIDLRAHRASATREARAYYAGPENARVVLAVALLVASPVSRLIGNFFLGVHRPPFPLRIFGETAPAVEWLRSAR
jgi:hypothetical protein